MKFVDQFGQTIDTAKTVAAALFSVFSSLLGYHGALLFCWVAVMLIDFATGSLAAKKNGEWSSRVSLEGRWRKVGELIAVLVAVLLDFAIYLFCHLFAAEFTWGGYFMLAVTAWYIITELGSILENVVKFGVKVPNWLIKGLKIGLSAVNDVADGVVGELEQMETALRPELSAAEKDTDTDETGEGADDGS